MKKTLAYIVCLLLFVAQPTKGQRVDASSTTEQLIADILEQYAEELEEDEINFESFYDDLMSLALNPINLNATTNEELRRLPFLSEHQIENILYYLYRFGKMQSIYELQLIEGLDMTDIRRMLPFVSLGDAVEVRKKLNWRDVLKYGRNDLLIRVDRSLDDKAGYQHLADDMPDAAETNARKYQGSPYYNSLRYKFRYSTRVEAGFTAEKDAGEQFWGEQHKGYDFYAGYIQLNNFGKFKTIVAGDFRVNFGQGLVVRQDFSMGKSAYVLNVSPRTSGLKKFGSTDEYNFFRGGGATVNLGAFDVTAFYSNKQIDGDTANRTFSSIYKTGLHRTPAEYAKKRNINQQVIGGNVSFNHAHFQIGLTAVHTLLDNEFLPNKSVYNYHYFEGKEQTTAGLHYRARWQKLHFFGETAVTGSNFALATINGLSFSPVSKVSLVLLQRYYAPEYDTFYATAFSETSRINNQRGIYIGAEIRPVKYWKLSAYADSYRFPWASYGIDAPSVGADYLLQADFSPNRNLTMYWRAKYEEKYTNISGTGAIMPVVVPIEKAVARYYLVFNAGQFSFKTQLDGNLNRRDESDWTYGVSALQDITYNFSSIPLKIDLRYQFFDAEVYDNRIYTYEKDVLYAFSIPMYYGLGSRYYVNLRYELNQHLSVWFKLAQTVYSDDRESIGTGNEMINGNRKTDARLLVRWKF